MTDRAFGTYEMKPGMGRHTFRKRGIVKPLFPGDSIDCFPDELGAALYKFKCIREPGPKEEPKVGLRVVQVGVGWYGVINESTGLPINDKKLRRDDAEKIVFDAGQTVAKAQLECAGCGALISEGDPRCKDEPTCKDCADELEEAQAKGADEE